MANELGFDINSSGLQQAAQASKDAAAGIKTVGQEAKTANDALKDFGASLGKIGSSSIASPFKSMSDGLTVANAQSTKLKDTVTSMGAAINAAIGKSAISFSDMTKGVAAASGALNTHAEAVNKAADAHGGLSTQGLAAFHSIRSLTEQLLAGQVSVASFAQQIGHLSYAASGPGGLTSAFGEVAKLIGPGGLIIGGAVLAAAALSGVSAAIASVADDSKRTQGRLESLTGSTKAGADSFSFLSGAAKSVGVDVKELEAPIEAALQGIGKMTTGFPVLKAGANQTGQEIKGLGALFTTLGQAMDATGSTAADIQKVWAALGQGIQKTGGLTADTFKQILTISPTAARALASAFHIDNFKDFEDFLQRQPQNLQDLEESVNKIGPAIQRNLDPNAPKTVEQATRELSAAWNDLLKTMASTGVFSGVTSIVNALTAALNGIAAAAAAAGNAIDILRGKGGGGSSGGSFAPQSESAGGPAGVFQAAPEGSSPAEAGAEGTMPAFATGGSFVVGGNGGTDSQTIQFKATPGEKVTIEPPGGGSSSGGQTLGSLMPASGGGGGNASADLISAHFANDLKTQTAALSDRINASRDAIVVAVNNAAAKPVAGATGTASTASVPAVAAPASSGSTSTASIGSTAAATPATTATAATTGGKLSADQGFDPFDPKQVARRAAQLHAEEEKDVPSMSQAAAMGLSMGTATPIRGFVSGSGQVTQNAMADPLHPLDRPGQVSVNPPSTTRVNPPSSFAPDKQAIQQQTQEWKTAQQTGSKTVADKVKEQGEKSDSIADKASGKLDGIQSAGKAAADAAGGTKDATEENTKSLEGGFETANKLSEDQKAAVEKGAEVDAEGYQQTQQSIDQGAQQTQQSIDQGSQQGVNATQEGSNSIVNAVQSLAESLTSAFQSVGQSIESAVSSAAQSAASSQASESGNSSNWDSGSSSSSGSSFDVGSAPSSDVTDISPMASGGLVSGPGSATSDSVPAMLSAGEFVHNAAAVQHYGADFMHAVNKRKLKKFSDGGPVTLGEAMGTPGNPGATADLVSAHFHETEKEQTASLKDAIKTSQNAIVVAISNSAVSITNAIKALDASMSSAMSATQSAGSSASSGSLGVGTSQSGQTYNTITKQGYRHYSGAVSGLDLFGGSAKNAQSYIAGGGNLAASNFATGGSFIVGGSGGTDSQKVTFNATPGERVTISPPGKEGAQIAPLLPANDDIPGSSFTPTMSMRPQSTNAAVGRVIPNGDPAGNPDRSARNVNIFVQQGVQADQFIKSRAQVQRAMG